MPSGINVCESTALYKLDWWLYTCVGQPQQHLSYIWHSEKYILQQIDKLVASFSDVSSKHSQQKLGVHDYTMISQRSLAIQINLAEEFTSSYISGNKLFL